MSRIRGAKEWGLRPTAAVTMDDDFGHRNKVTGERKLPRGTWTTWDYLLLNVHQLITDFTDQNGFLVWELEDPQERTVVEGRIKTDRAEAVRGQMERRHAKELERPGRYIALKMTKPREEDEYPTHTEFFERLAEEE